MERYTKNTNQRDCMYGSKCHNLKRGDCRFYHPPEHSDLAQTNSKKENYSNNDFSKNQNQRRFFGMTKSDIGERKDQKILSLDKELEKELSNLLSKVEITDKDKLAIQTIFEKFDCEQCQLPVFYKFTNLLDKIVQSSEKNKNEFISIANHIGIFNQDLFRKFGGNLSNNRSLNDRNSCFQAGKAINSIINFYQLLMIKIPSSSININIDQLAGFADFFRTRAIPNYYSLCFEQSEIEEKKILEDLESKVEILKKQKEVNDSIYSVASKNETKTFKMNYQGTQQNHQCEDEGEPEDNFKDISLYPTPKDFKKFEGILRKNKPYTPFKNLNQYLDIHFRLLREDFYCSLRNGFEFYVNKQQKTKNSFLRFSQGKVTTFVVTNKLTGVNLTIYLPKTRRILFNKRFICGSMLIISNDKFNNYMVCIIKNVDDKDCAQTIKKGYINVQVEIVKTDYSLDIQDVDLFDSNFEIIETKVYFEPYYQVLQALKDVNQFPLRELIVHCNFAENISPLYLSKALDRYDERGRLIMILNPEIQSYVEQWVNNETHKFDESKKIALRHIFNSKIALIQGPPGTGKTFVGVHLVRILLHLKSKKLFTGPIFIICYTNHALDQFLEFLVEHTIKITRLGGQTKKETMKPFTLQEKRQKNKGLISRNYKYYLLLKEKEIKMDEYSELKILYEKYYSYPFITDFQMFASDESWYFENILSNYQAELNGFIKKIFSENRVKSKLFKKYYETRFQHVPVFGLAVLYWLEILNFEIIFNKWSEEENIKEAKNQIEDQYKDALEDLEIQKKLEQDLEENKYLEEDKDIEKQIMKEDHILFMNSEPIDNPKNNFRNNYDFFDDYNSRLKERLSEGDKVYQKIFSKSNNDFIISYRNKFERRAPVLSKAEKWILNSYFINRKTSHMKEISKLLVELRTLKDELNEIEDLYSKELIENDDIIAMTTTGAAKYKNILKKISARVIIVEEAAEVLESHIAVSLTPKTEHLILIGDHMQLRPSVNDFDLAHKYHLDISMFERLVNNKINNVVILDQRRMRPEISGIIRLLYPSLIDSPKVLNKPNIKCFLTPVYFFTHNWEENKVEESDSKVNHKEADFIYKFTEVLIKNGYKQDQITILSLYSGQLIYIKKNFNRNELLQNIKVVTVDNYQGEENDIILLSLVRSNKEKKIGFIKVTNRVNVALSRAKLGLFIFGNAECIRDHEQRAHKNDLSKSFWLKVMTYLKEKNFIGDHINISCSNHGNVISLKTIDDFKNCPNGGCKMICKMRRKCGHSCKDFCHEYNITNDDIDGHSLYPCSDLCERKHECGHICGNICSKCDLKTWKCPKIVMYEHPTCKHKFRLPCHRTKNNPSTIECLNDCDKILPCGHRCQKKCYEDCNYISKHQTEQGFKTSCQVKTEYKRECGHDLEKPCGQSEDKFLELNKCQKICGKEMKCSHQCPAECQKCFDIFKIEGIYVHDKCLQSCNKTLVCDHKCNDTCTYNKFCSPCIEPCHVKCLHSKCPKKCGEICSDCIELCAYQCPHKRCGRKCHEFCDREPCDESCPKTLSCGHKCMGLCGEICPNICSICDPDNEAFKKFFGNEDDKNPKFVELDCGHCFEVGQMDKYYQSKLTDATIQYIKCMNCQKQIRFCMRYQNSIKQITQRISEVKSKISKEAERLFDEIQINLITSFKNYQKQYSQKKELYDYLEKWCEMVSKNSNMQINYLIDLHRSMSRVEMLLKIIDKCPINISIENILRISESFRSECLNLNNSERKEILLTRALDTFQIYLTLLEIELPLLECQKYIRVNVDGILRVRPDYRYAINFKNELEEKKGFISKPLYERICYFIKEVCKQRKNIEIKPVSIRAFPKVLEFTSDHWHQCSNGHPYAIGEKSESTELLKCPDCGVYIGGNNHQLLQSNQHGGWIDENIKSAFDITDKEASLRAIRRIKQED